MNFFEKVKSSITIPQYWAKANLPGTVRDVCVVKSPVRDDRNPSFSIFDGGRKFKDHACAEHHGDIFDFVRLVHDCDEAQACRILSEVTGIENIDYEYDGLDSIKIKKPVVHSSVQSYAITPACIPWKEYTGWPELNAFINKKRISPSVIMLLYNQGHISFEDRVLNYHYSTGTKTRWDWGSSRSTRWRVGKAADAVWLMHNVVDQDSDARETIYCCEGESDAMRLMSHPLMGDARIVCIPSASWTPSPVLAGTIGNCRDVVLCFDNDDAGRKAKRDVTKALSEHALNCHVCALETVDGCNDLCDMDDATLSRILKPFV